MELRHLRYFVAVAEELHFGHAAARLHMAQPPLSRQIQDLEGELGVTLLSRDRRHVALTPAGETFLQEARGLLARVTSAEDATRRTARGESGRLRIGYVPSVAATRFPELLRSFHRRAPDVALSVRELNPAQQVEALRRDEIDVGFARGPLAEPELATRPWVEEALAVALPRAHPLARRRRIRLAALAREAFILPARARGPGLHDEIVALCRDAGFSPRVLQEGSQLDVQLLVAAGVGVAVVPASHRILRHGGVVLRALAERPITRVVVAWRSANASPVLHRFLELLA